MRIPVQPVKQEATARAVASFVQSYKAVNKVTTLISGLMMGASVLAACQSSDSTKHLTLVTLRSVSSVSVRKPPSYYPYMEDQLGYYYDSIRQQEHYYFLNGWGQQLLRASAPLTERLPLALKSSGINLASLFNSSLYPMMTFGVISPDSLLFLDGQQRNLCLTTATGEQRMQWQPRAPVYGQTPYGIGSLGRSLECRDGRLYTWIFPELGKAEGDSATYAEGNSFAPCAIWSLRDTTVGRVLAGGFPALYQKHLTRNQAYYETKPSGCVMPTGEALISFGASPDLQRIDLAGNVATVAAASRHHRPSLLLPFHDFFNHKTILRYGLRNPNYTTLLYDPFRQHYLRVYMHGLSEAALQGVVQDYSSVPWSLIILDASLRVIGETDFDSSYDANQLLVTKRGVLVGHNRVQKPGYNKDSLIFRLFTYAHL